MPNSLKICVYIYTKTKEPNLCFKYYTITPFLLSIKICQKRLTGDKSKLSVIEYIMYMSSIQSLHFSRFENSCNLLFWQWLFATSYIVFWFQKVSIFGSVLQSYLSWVAVSGEKHLATLLTYVTAQIEYCILYVVNKVVYNMVCHLAINE